MLAVGQNGGVTGLIGPSGATHNGKIFSWAGDLDGNVDDVSGYGDAGWSEHKTGQKRFTGIAAGLIKTDSGVAPGFSSVGTEAALTLTADTGKTYTFNAIVYNIKIRHSYAGGRQLVTFAFAANGAVTETWA